MKSTTTTAVLIATLICGLAVGCASPETTDDEEPAAEAPQQEETDVDETDDEELADETDDVRSAIEAAAEGDHRSSENIDRNQYRNPVETLMFFGFEPGLEVVEIWPGGGWYTEVLAPVLVDDGSLTAGIFEIDEDDPEDYRTRITLEYLEWLDDESETLGDVETTTFSPPETVELGEPESAEMVLTFRNLHNMHRDGLLEDGLAAFYEVLEPGGTLGVVQHRAPEGSDPDEMAPEGYLPEAFVVEQAEDAGFELEESSEVNANPDDTADHEDGVWSLPPSLRGGEEGEDAERFLAIGESDRMTLRFVKPE